MYVRDHCILLPPMQFVHTMDGLSASMYFLTVALLTPNSSAIHQIGIPLRIPCSEMMYPLFSR